jgi:hypothetical protein
MGAAALVPAQTQAPDDEGSILPELPYARVELDLVRGKTATESRVISFLFSKGDSYYTLKKETLNNLITNPAIEFDPGVQIDIVNLGIEERPVRRYQIVSALTGQGYSIKCTAMISVPRETKPGVYKAALTFPLVPEYTRTLGLGDPQAPVGLEYSLSVFDSENALKKELKKREEKRQAALKEDENKGNPDFKKIWAGIKKRNKLFALCGFLACAFVLWLITRLYEKVGQKSGGLGLIPPLVGLASIIIGIMFLIRILFIWP